MKLALILLALALSGCGTLQQRAEHAAAADTVTTLTGLALGAAEANPLGLVALLVKIPVLAYADTLPTGERESTQAAIVAAWGGAAVNNACVIAAILTGGAIAPICPLIGIAWGVREWARSSEEREFWRMCQYHREQTGRHLDCVYRRPT